MQLELVAHYCKICINKGGLLNPRALLMPPFGVFSAQGYLRPRFRLAPPIHTPRGVSGSTVYPLKIAAHPGKRNQFALAMSERWRRTSSRAIRARGVLETLGPGSSQ